MVVMVVRAQLRLSLCDPRPCSLPGSSIHGILQARILEWVAMPSSRVSPPPSDRTCILSLLHWQVVSLPLVLPGKPWMVAQLCKYTKDHWTVPFRWAVWYVNFIVVKLLENNICHHQMVNSNLNFLIHSCNFQIVGNNCEYYFLLRGKLFFKVFFVRIRMMLF